MGFFSKKKKGTALVAGPRPAPPGGPDDRNLAELVHEVADHVVVLHDLVFQRAVVRCERAGGRLRVASIDVTLAPGGGEPHDYARDPLVRTALLSDACDALAASLAAEGHAWDGRELALERAGDHVHVVASDEALRATVAVRDLVPSPAFLATVTRARAGIDERQERARASYAGKPWSFDQSTSTLVFTGTTKVPATLLGTFSGEQYTWLWSWANPSLDAVDTTQLRATCDRLAADGQRVFACAGLPCDEGFAWSVALAAASLCSRPALYTAPVGPTRVFFAIE
jgi:hypothetical protein